MFNNDLKICHIYENNHKMDFGSVRVVGNKANFHEQLRNLEMTTSPSQKSTSLWHAHAL